MKWEKHKVSCLVQYANILPMSKEFTALRSFTAVGFGKNKNFCGIVRKIRTRWTWITSSLKTFIKIIEVASSATSQENGIFPSNHSISKLEYIEQIVCEEWRYLFGFVRGLKFLVCYLLHKKSKWAKIAKFLIFNLDSSTEKVLN